MTAAPASPQQIRDRLLQAIDPQSNIHNMVAVLEVISSLEKYPITKEALEETRLGKLINDVRKKTKNEELAKRAKKLLRSWQKLIEPVTQNEPVPRGLPNPPGSANGGAHNCRPDVSPATVPGSKPIHELKNRNDIQKLNSPKTEKLGNRKRKGEHRDGHQGPPSKVSKASHELLQNSSPLPTNGIGGSPENFPSPLDVNLHTGPESSRTEHSENDKHSKIPVNAVKPHTSSPGLVKPSSTSSQLKTTVLQHHEKPEEPTGQHQPKSPRCSFSSSNLRHEPFLRQHPTYAPKGSLPSPSQRPHFLDASQASSPSSRAPSLMQASTPPVSTKRPEASHQTGVEASQHWQEHTSSDSHQRHLGTLQHMTSGCKVSSPSGEPLMPRVGFSPEASKMDSDDNAASGSDSKKKKRYRSRDYTVNLDGQVLEGGVKPVRLKERKITFDPMTGQIKPLTQKDSLQVDIPALADQHRTEPDKPEQKTNLQSPFEQTNWKELSRNEIIQSYLNRQSSLLSSSGVQTPGAHYFMSEYLKQEESTRREARKTHVLVPNSISTDLPGVSREVTNDDLNRIRQLHWPGVNGCYDTQGNWYDWTQCISLDPHGDDGRLNILPYVCLD